jgi:hypothetical protein
MSLRLLSVFSVFAALWVLITLGIYDVTAYIVLLIASLASFFYVTRLNSRDLRDIPHLKIHLISFAWVTVLVLFPMLNEGKGENALWMGIAHYIYILAIAIPFDIRDLKYDSPSQHTIPQVVGVDVARIFAVFLLVVFGALMLYINQELWSNALFYVSVFSQIALILFMNEKRSDLYCAIGIDGAITLLGLSYFL